MGTAGRGDLTSDERDAVLIVGTRDDTNEGVMLYLGVEPELYEVKDGIPVDMYTVFGVAGQGPLGLDIPLVGFVFGTIDLTQAGTAPGERVVGSFQVEIWGGAPE